MADERTYSPERDENCIAFMHRVIADQPEREPLHIVEQLVEIVIGELKGSPCEISATGSNKSLTVKLHHSGRPIDDRLVLIMYDHTDRVEYNSDGYNGWWLTLRRDIPKLFIAH